jgi:predicted RNA-binding protein YlqC (UPF0109 family)
MTTESKLRSLLHEIVRELVDDPSKVIVAETISDGGATSVLTVRVASGETGKVIGKGGRNAQALRTLFEAMAAKNRRRVMLEIADGGRRVRRGGSDVGAQNR